LQRGVSAFDRGDGQEARRLLQAAMNQGAPSDEALAVLDRLNRLEQGNTAQVRTAGSRGDRVPVTTSAAAFGRSTRFGWMAAGAFLLVMVAAGLFAAGATRPEWGAVLGPPAAAPANPAARSLDAALPLPRRAETALTRARSLAVSGRLRDALTALDHIRPTDNEKPEADRLRAEIQKQLLGLASIPRPATGVHETGDASRP
jgi:hypothetical protein